MSLIGPYLILQDEEGGLGRDRKANQTDMKGGGIQFSLFY
jgi:hypothetical protein